MADHIPFVTGKDVCSLVNELYSDSAFARVPLDKAEGLLDHLDETTSLWLDPSVDGMDDVETRRSKLGPDGKKRKNSWFEFMKVLPNFDKMATPAYHAKPTPGEVDAFVEAVMGKCAAHHPAWITVPQLPLVTDAKRNKINRALAKATGKWKISSGFSGHLILPLVFTHQKQVNLKKYRSKKVREAEVCYNLAQADGLWVVESSLGDEKGSSTLRKRLSSMIALHEELDDHIPARIRIAGPYWGLNLVLWARNLVDYPAIGIGTGYQYLLAGGPTHPASAKLALASLRRRVGVKQLGKWLDSAMRALGPSHPANVELRDIRRNRAVLSDPARAKKQVAEAYKQWFDMIAAAPEAGRPMALYQDLSAAFALGRSLPPLPEAGPARKPEAVAEPLMLNCL